MATFHDWFNKTLNEDNFTPPSMLGLINQLPATRPGNSPQDQQMATKQLTTLLQQLTSQGNSALAASLQNQLRMTGNDPVKTLQFAKRTSPQVVSQILGAIGKPVQAPPPPRIQQPGQPI